MQFRELSKDKFMSINEVTPQKAFRKVIAEFLSLLNLTKECRVLNVGQSFEKFFSSRV